MLSNRNPVGVKFANVSFRVARFVSTDLVSRTLYLALSVAPALASFLGFLLGAPLSFSEGASWALFSEAFDGERSTVNSLITGNCANDFLKRSSVIRYNRDALAAAADDIRLMAAKEGLTAHSASVDIRLTEAHG